MTETARKEPTPTSAKDIARRFFTQEYAILALVLAGVIGVFAAITNTLTTSRANISNVLLQSSMRGVASVGQAFVILTGGIDLSVGGIGLMASLLGASLMSGYVWQNIIGAPLSHWVVMPIMLLVAAGWGAINGVGVSRLGVPALIVTLALWEITTGVGFQICGGMSIRALPIGFAFFGSGTVLGVPVPVIIFIVVVVLAYLVLNHTIFGRSIYATGGNPVSAWLAGINVNKILFSVYIISGFLAGLASIIGTARIMSASMLSMGGLEIDSIAAVVIGGVSLAGGRGNLIGVVLGVLIIGVINNGLSIIGADPAVQGIVKGIIIFAAVAIDVARRQRG